MVPSNRDGFRGLAVKWTGEHAELQPQGHRAALARLLAGEQDLPHARPLRQAEVLHPRHVPLPLRRRPARRPSRGLHRHRHPRPLPAHARLQRAAPDGLGRLRPAGRAVRHQDRHAPARHHREEHQHLPPADPDARLQLRLGPRGRYHRPQLLPLDAVDLPAPVRHLVRRRAEARPADRRAADPAGSEAAGRVPPSAPTATASGWRIRRRCRSTGARRWARCWPTRK